MSRGKSSGQRRSEIKTTGAGSASASSSSAADVDRITDALTSATSAAVASAEMIRDPHAHGAGAA